MMLNNYTASPIAPTSANTPAAPAAPVKYEIGTIRQMHRRLVSEGILVTEHALRVWVKSGQISAVMVGQRAYISYTKVMEFLYSPFPGRARS